MESVVPRSDETEALASHYIIHANIYNNPMNSIPRCKLLS